MAAAWSRALKPQSSPGLHRPGVRFVPNLEVAITVLGQPTEDQIAVQDQWKKIGVTLTFKTATSTDQLFAAVRTDPLAFGPFAVGQQPAG